MAFDPSIFDDIDANLHILEIEEIKSRLSPLTIGYKIETPIFDAGAFLYRARKFGTSFNKYNGIKYVDLIYPPKNASKLGRLNRPGEAVFYCSMRKESVFFEIQDLQESDEIILTFWKTKQRMLVNNIGYTEYIFNMLGAKRAVPQWVPDDPELGSNHTTIVPRVIPQELIDMVMSEDVISETREAFSRYFMRTVGPQEVDSYKVTTAIGELHLGNIVNHDFRFAGILYPSVRMWANGDNLAVLPWFVDQHIEFRKALHIRIDDRNDPKISITAVDSAKEFGPDGNLVWLGRLPNWTLKQGQQVMVELAPGFDEDGDYQMSADGKPCHWTIIDSHTGQQIPAL